jgi:hypothetical protein
MHDGGVAFDVVRVVLSCYVTHNCAARLLLQFSVYLCELINSGVAVCTQDGTVVGRYPSTTNPSQIAGDIEKLL